MTQQRTAAQLQALAAAASDRCGEIKEQFVALDAERTALHRDKAWLKQETKFQALWLPLFKQWVTDSNDACIAEGYSAELRDHWMRELDNRKARCAAPFPLVVQEQALGRRIAATGLIWGTNGGTPAVLAPGSRYGTYQETQHEWRRLQGEADLARLQEDAERRDRP